MYNKSSKATYKYNFRPSARRGARIAWLGGGGAEINFGGTRSLFMWIRVGHGGTRNLSQSESNEQGEDRKFRGIFRLKSEIQTFFPTENRWSKKKGFTGILRGFRPKSEIQTFFSAENRRSPKKKRSSSKNVMKSGVSPQKWQKYQWQAPIWASICTTVAPSLLISSGHSSRLGGAQFCLGGTSSHLGGHDPGMPPRGARPAFRYVFIRRLKK